MKIRKATFDDVDELRTLFLETIVAVNSKDYNEEQIKVWSTSADQEHFLIGRLKEQHFLVAESNGVITGFASLSDAGYFDTMYVHKDFQGQGVGTLLLNAIEKVATALEVSQINTDVSITARSFFEKHGYQVDRQQQKHVRGTVFINYLMSKKLSSETSFKDHFSKQSDVYLKARPTYPAELFKFLANACTKTDKAWDCATGNGQAAISLAEHFQQVIATDASQQQITNAIPYPNIKYRVAPAENCGIKDKSIDLITVASGLHWFDFNRFYAEAKRVLKPGGIIAVWCYTGSKISPTIDVVTSELGVEILKDYWPKENQLVWNHYKGIPFPFKEITTPQFQCIIEWNLAELENYFSSWSATQKYKEATGQNPVDIVHNQLKTAWVEPIQRKNVVWDLTLKVGRFI
jgi:ubiquinone/menaquinone biosynthesis C-methylase UbiE/N-acetylglutamate synthase-like GNAT family acetyltransferase